MSGAHTLNDVCEFIVDCLHATAPVQDSGYPLIRTPNIGRGRLLFDGVYRVSDDTYETWTQRATPQVDDLILAREAPAGNVAIVKEGESVCLGQRTVHLRPNKAKVDPDFLCYLLLTPLYQGRLLAGETGATAKHVNMKDIRRLKLDALPSIEQQRRYGQVIAAYDDLIENNRRRIKLLEESARLLYREWFVHLRFPGHEHVKIVDGVPEGWERKSIADMFDTTSGGTPSRASPENFDGNINWVKTQELDERFIFDTQEHISEAALKDSAAKLFPEGTLLVSIYGGTNIGRTGLLAKASASNQACVALMPKRKPGDVLFAQKWLQENREYLVGLGQGAAQTNINQQTLRSQIMLVPTEELLDEFIDCIKPMYEQLANLCQQVSGLGQARDLLLPRLMSGEITV